MPAARDPDDDDERAPDLVDDSPTTGFLDLPDLAADRVIDAVLDGLSRLDDDAVLTAYCTEVDADTMSALCERHDVEIVHSVTQVVGITFVLRRSRR